jgi:hypothetical protein
MHKPLGKPPTVITGALSRDDLCRLSRGFNMTASLGLSQDARINDWLKAQIEAAH